MITFSILQPVVALLAWTMVMWLWMYATRLPAMGKAKIDTASWVGGKGSDLDAMLPDKVQWKAHNYNHLHEAPTLFYAVALLLAMTGNGGGHGTQVAWAYVTLRVVHSLIQVTVNRVALRFVVFALSSFCLMALILRAAQVVF